MKAFLFASFLSTILILTSCTNNEYISYSGYTQGTTWHIKFKNEAPVSQEEIENILWIADTNFSIYNKMSLISKINNNENHTTNPCFDSLIYLSQKVWSETNGYFDLTVGPLVKFWGFGPQANTTGDTLIPDSLKAITGMNKIKLENQRIIKDNPGIILDANAIAQGYSVDMVSDMFDAKGIKNYMIEIGGEVKAIGKNDKGNDWQIGIDKPIEESDENNRELQEIVSLSGLSLATSGSYRKFHEKDGIKYSHTINPLTGYPSHHNLLSVTITAPDCGEADAIATAVMAMGMENGKVFINSHGQYQAYFIYSDSTGQFQTWMTPGFKKMISEDK